MYLQVVCLVIMLLLTSSAVAAECKSELTGIKAYFYSQGDEWSLLWKADGVYKEKASYNIVLQNNERTNVHQPWGHKRAASLPQALLKPDRKLSVPFDVSRNGEYLIAAIYRSVDEKADTSYLSKQFALVDLRKQYVVRIFDTEYKIQSLAWSPDNQYFAVLYRQDVTEQVFKGPLDWFADLIGHPISYWTYHITIYQPDGIQRCTVQVAQKKPNAMGYIDWE